MKQANTSAAVVLALLALCATSTAIAQQKTHADYVAEHARRMEACPGSTELCCVRAAMCVNEIWEQITRDVEAKRTVRTFNSDAMTSVDLFARFVHGVADGLRAPTCPPVIRLAYTRWATEESAKLDILATFRNPIDQRTEIFGVGQAYLAMRGKPYVDSYYVCKSERAAEPATKNVVTGDAIYVLRLAGAALSKSDYPAASAYASVLTSADAPTGNDDAIRADAYFVLGKAQEGLNANAEAAQAFRGSLRTAPNDAARVQALDAMLALALKTKSYDDATAAVDGKIKMTRAAGNRHATLDLQVTKSRVLSASGDYEQSAALARGAFDGAVQIEDWGTAVNAIDALVWQRFRSVQYVEGCAEIARLREFAAAHRLDIAAGLAAHAARFDCTLPKSALELMEHGQRMSDLNHRGDHAGALAAAHKLVELADRASRADAATARKAAQAYAQASYVALFGGEYRLAESLARRALEIEPQQVWMQTNLAHALLLSGQRAKAEEIYYRFIGRKTESGPTWEAAVADDFEKLRAAGRADPAFEEILARLRR